MEYTEEQIKMTVKNVANNSEGVRFIEILLDKLGAYERGCNFNNHDIEVFNRGRREQGLWLLDLLKESNFNKFIEIETRRRKELCQEKKQQQKQQKQEED